MVNVYNSDNLKGRDGILLNLIDVKLYYCLFIMNNLKNHSKFH